jgi:hypothetical protein
LGREKPGGRHIIQGVVLLVLGIDHLHENLEAIDVQLTPADLREIETALSKIEVHGGRMNEERMMAVDQTE